MGGRPFQILAVEIREIALHLPPGGGDRAVHQFLRRLDADLIGFVHRDQHGGVHEAGRIGARFLGADAKIVIAPAAIDGLVSVETLELLLDQLANLSAAGLVAGLAIVHPRQRADRVSVSPDVVQRVGCSTAQMRQVLEQPELRPIDGGLRARRVATTFDQRRDAQRGHRRAKCMMGPGNRGVDIQALGPLGASPGAILILVVQKKLDATIDGRLQLAPIAGRHRGRLGRRLRSIGSRDVVVDVRGTTDRGKRGHGDHGTWQADAKHCRSSLSCDC